MKTAISPRLAVRRSRKFIIFTLVQFWIRHGVYKDQGQNFLIFVNPSTSTVRGLDRLSENLMPYIAD